MCKLFISNILITIIKKIMIIFWASSFSAFLAIFLWIKNEIINSKWKWKKLLYPITFIILSSIAIYQFYKLDEMIKIENEAKNISKDWPEVERITFLSKGERLGIIMSGLTFLEKHKDKFPETYNEFKNLKKGRLGNYSAKHNIDDNLNEYNDLEDVCGATITMIRNFKSEN